MTLRPEKMEPAHPEFAEELWRRVRAEAVRAAEEEPCLDGMLADVIFSRGSLEDAIAARLARKLARRDMDRDGLESVICSTLRGNAGIRYLMAADLQAVVERDAACRSPLEPLLFFKGFHALCVHRVAHELWARGRTMMALFFQSIASEVFAIDIHPAARLGCGILVDHGAGFVVGETAIVENDVSVLHEVTLGGTGKETGDRHPVVRSGVLIGAGAKVLGRVEIGECAKIAASSVVLADVPPHTTVAGVPAAVVGLCDDANPSLDMNQDLRVHS